MPDTFDPALADPALREDIRAAELRDILDDLLDEVSLIADDIGDYKIDDLADAEARLADAIAKARGRL